MLDTKIVEDVISSYEEKVEMVSSLFDTSTLAIGDFQESFLETKEEREALTSQVREFLSKNEHLRKKDFDRFMGNILSLQEEREREVKNSLKSYVNEQRQLGTLLRKNLAEFKASIAVGESQRRTELQEMMKGILQAHETRREKVKALLEGFQKEQRELGKRLRELLAYGKDLRIKNLKRMIEEFKIQSQERMVQTQERRKEACERVADFSSKKENKKEEY